MIVCVGGYSKVWVAFAYELLPEHTSWCVDAVASLQTNLFLKWIVQNQ